MLNALSTGTNLPLPQGGGYELRFVPALHCIVPEKIVFEFIISGYRCHVYLIIFVTPWGRKYGYILYQFSGESDDLSINVNRLKHNMIYIYHFGDYRLSWRGDLRAPVTRIAMLAGA
jgi:hypothetical protein